MRVFRRLLPSPRTWRGKVGIAAFFTVFIVLASTTAGYAYWQSSITATSTVAAADLAISTTNLTGATFNNSTQASQGSITFQNSTITSSTKTGAVTVTVIGSGALASNVTRQLWLVTDPATCGTATVPSGTPAPMWNTTATLTATLAPGASASYCVRSVITSRQDVATVGGGQSFTPSVTGKITLGNFIGTATATATQATQAIYPVTTPVTGRYYWIRPNFTNPSYNYCLDVSGGATTAGTIVISYGCKFSGASNQQWTFTAGASTYYSITPRNAGALSMDNNSSTSADTGIIVDTSGSGNDQRWQLQAVSPGVVQIVNSLSGMCLTSPDGTAQNLGQITQTVCVGGQYQQFLLSEAFQDFSCTASTSAAAWVFGWTSNVTGPYYARETGSATNLATTTAIAAGVNVPYSAFAAAGTYNLTFTDANNTVEGTAVITVTHNAFFGTTTRSCSSTSDLQ